MSQNRFHQLMQRHARLEQEIGEESRRPLPDQARILRLKKLKLAIKDQIALLETQDRKLAAA